MDNQTYHIATEVVNGLDGIFPRYNVFGIYFDARRKGILSRIYR